MWFIGSKRSSIMQPKQGGEQECIFSGSQTVAPSTSCWISSLSLALLPFLFLSLSHTPQQQWPVMCGFNCNKTARFVRSPSCEVREKCSLNMKAFFLEIQSRVLLLLLYICWTFHSHTLNPRGDQFSTQNPSFINTQVDLTYSAARGCGCIHESLT